MGFLPTVKQEVQFPETLKVEDINTFTPIKGYSSYEKPLLSGNEENEEFSWESPLKLIGPESRHDILQPEEWVLEIRQRVNLGRMAVEKILLEEGFAKMKQDPNAVVRKVFGSKYYEYKDYARELINLAQQYDEQGYQYPMEEAYRDFFDKHAHDKVPILGGNLEFMAIYMGETGHIDSDAESVGYKTPSKDLQMYTPEKTLSYSIYPSLPGTPIVKKEPDSPQSPVKSFSYEDIEEDPFDAERKYKQEQEERRIKQENENLVNAAYRKALEAERLKAYEEEEAKYYETDEEEAEDQTKGVTDNKTDSGSDDDQPID